MDSKRTTIYFKPHLHRALRLKAAEIDRSVSDLVNEVVRLGLAEDAEDLAAFEDPRFENSRLSTRSGTAAAELVASTRSATSPCHPPVRNSRAAPLAHAQGDYRVVYEVDDQRRIVTIVKVGHYGYYGSLTAMPGTWKRSK